MKIGGLESLVFIQIGFHHQEVKHNELSKSFNLRVDDIWEVAEDHEDGDEADGGGGD